jgi:hypothetical protein
MRTGRNINTRKTKSLKLIGRTVPEKKDGHVKGRMHKKKKKKTLQTWKTNGVVC